MSVTTLNIGVNLPTSLSKSMEKAIGCERYFALRYLDGTLPLVASSPMSEIGTQFHAYRAAYIDHLVSTVQREDPEWVAQWLDTSEVCEDARSLIERDATRFWIDPEKVFGTELFLSVDSSFRPLEQESTPEPGRPPKNPKAFLHGTVDLLAIDGEQATIIDAKSGWSTQNVKEYEAVHYALLVFSHFPYISQVTFLWDFIRAEGLKPITFHRSELPELQRQAEGRHRTMRSIANRYSDGTEMAVNPQAGLCQFCEFTCPIRDAVKRKLLEYPPLQNIDDAKRVALLVYTARCTAAVGEQLLKAWLDINGPLDLERGVVAEFVLGQSDTYPLRPTLKVLGFDTIPEKAPKWDVPLDSLVIGTTKLKSYANTKKRAGLMDELKAIAITRPTSTLKIHRPKTAKETVKDQGEAAA